jgi:LysR family pca operon transcriptional activator
MLKKHAQIPLKLTSVRVRQLQLFSLAAEVGSISEAARRCHVTQPTATEMLQDLERAFSRQLFIRGPKGIVLTPEGVRVAARTAAALNELQWAVAEASSNTSREILRVGFVSPVMYDHLPRVVQQFTTANPKVLLSLRQLPTPECVLALVEGEIDVAITMNQPSFNDDRGEKVHVRTLAVQTQRVFLSSSLDLASGWSPTTEALRQLMWILPSQDATTRAVFEEWFFHQGVAPPESFIEISPPTAAIEMLRTMPCAALLPDTPSLAHNFPHLQRVTGDAFALPVRLVVACKESHAGRAAVRAFMDEVVRCHDDQAGKAGDVEHADSAMISPPV